MEQAAGDQNGSELDVHFDSVVAGFLRGRVDGLS
jgi:hypothetical protein